MIVRWIFPIAALALGACERRPEPAPGDDLESTTETANQELPSNQSIIRQDVLEESEAPAEEEGPKALVLRFTEEGELDQASSDALEAMLSDSLVGGNRPILLRGHSDSRGNDDANREASAERAATVRDVLVARGIAEDRIQVLALGEDRPFAPNAHPDGSDNPEGRALNRRVDVELLDAASAPVGARETPSVPDQRGNL